MARRFTLHTEPGAGRLATGTPIAGLGDLAAHAVEVSSDTALAHSKTGF